MTLSFKFEVSKFYSNAFSKKDFQELLKTKEYDVFVQKERRPCWA